MNEKAEKKFLISIKLKIQDNVTIRNRLLERHGFVLKNEKLYLKNKFLYIDRHFVVKSIIKMVICSLFAIGGFFAFKLEFFYSAVFLITAYFAIPASCFYWGNGVAEKAKLVHEDYQDLTSILTKEEFTVLLKYPGDKLKNLTLFDIYSEIEEKECPEFFEEVHNQKKQAYLDEIFSSEPKLL